MMRNGTESVWEASQIASLLYSCPIDTITVPRSYFLFSLYPFTPFNSNPPLHHEKGDEDGIKIEAENSYSLGSTASIKGLMLFGLYSIYVLLSSFVESLDDVR